jgi:dCMP deaminase
MGIRVTGRINDKRLDERHADGLDERSGKPIDGGLDERRIAGIDEQPGKSLDVRPGKSLDVRPGWDVYFMDIARLVAARSTCLRRQVGAVIVKGQRILATGYNGAPTGLRHCAETGCLREQRGIPRGERHELCRGIHAEQNALLQCAVHGVSSDGAMLYCTTQPCGACAKMLINAGIREIVFEGDYPDGMTAGLLGEAGVTSRKLQGG